MKKTIIAALLGATVLAGGAVAAVQGNHMTQDTQQHRTMRGPMNMGDANGDGVTTREEAIAAAEAHFAKLDANKDGKVTRDERRAAREAMGKRMRGADGDHGRRGMKRGSGPMGDGVMTLEEHRAQALKRFDFIDRNSDGRIDQAERKLVREMMREMGHGRGHRRGGHAPQPGAEVPAPSTNGS